MSPVIVAIAIPALLSQALWACVCLIFWLCRHWKLHKVPVYRRAAKKAFDELTSRTPSHPRAKPQWVRNNVLYLASHLHSCRQVADAFNRRQGCRATVGKSWVAQLVKDNAEEIKRLRRERKRRAPYFIAVGHTWALDLTFIQSPYGLTFTILGIIDAGSRKLLYLKVLPGKCAFALIGHLFLALSEHGLPFAIRTDNESMFTGVMWRTTLKALSIIHRRGPPRQPWHNGRIERLFGTLKPLLRKMRFEAMQSLQAALDEFKDFYNIVRPHQALAGLTPEEAWQGKTMKDVQEANAQAEGQWVQALGGQLVGYHVRR